MPLVPFCCFACDRYWLQSEAPIDPRGEAACECGGMGRAISASRYEAADASLFAAIVDSLLIARLSPLQAGRLLLELELREEISPAVQLARMSELVPSLCIIELIATARVETARKAVRMFVVLLQAMAARRSVSDVSELLEHRSAGNNGVRSPGGGNTR